MVTDCRRHSHIALKRETPAFVNEGCFTIDERRQVSPSRTRDCHRNGLIEGWLRQDLESILLSVSGGDRLLFHLIHGPPVTCVHEYGRSNSQHDEQTEGQ